MIKPVLQFIFCLSMLLSSSPAHDPLAGCPLPNELTCQQSATELFFIEVDCSQEISHSETESFQIILHCFTDNLISVRYCEPEIIYCKKSFSAGKVCSFLPLRL